MWCCSKFVVLTVKICPTVIIQRTEGVKERERGREKLTDVNVAILVEPVDDEGEDEANVAGVVVG